MLNKLKKILKGDEKKRIIKEICKEYKNAIDEDDIKFVSFLRKNINLSSKLFDVDYAPMYIFGDEWPLEYLNKEYICDMSEKYPYVMYHNKRIYMPSSMNCKEIISYIRSIDIEQDRRSPHGYFNGNINLKDQVVVDIGAAEGNFAIDNFNIDSKTNE